MAPNRHGSAHIEYPNDLEILLTREFDAPIQLVFDVVTKPEHVSRWFAPYGRDHMSKTDGFESSYDNVEDLLRSLLDPNGTVSA